MSGRGLWRKNPETKEGKYPIILRRDGSVLNTPYFVMTLKDPCTAHALAAYATAAKKLSFDSEYVQDIREMASESLRLSQEDMMREEGPTADPDAPRHRQDDSDVLRWVSRVVTGEDVRLCDLLREAKVTEDSPVESTNTFPTVYQRIVRANKSGHGVNLSVADVRKIVARFRGIYDAFEYDELRNKCYNMGIPFEEYPRAMLESIVEVVRKRHKKEGEEFLPPFIPFELCSWYLVELSPILRWVRE